MTTKKQSRAAWCKTLLKVFALTLLLVPPLSAQTTPSITSLSVNAASWYGSQFTLTVTGQSFINGAQVQFGSTLLAANFVSSTEISATVPSTALNGIGSTVVRVVNPSGELSSPVSFFVLERGDINHNRSVSIGDALVTALTVGGARQTDGTPYPQLLPQVGDINLNGAVSIGDALVLARYTGGLDANFPIPTITSASSNPASAGAVITLTGSGFSATPELNQVVFTTAGDGITRAVPSAATPTSLTLTVPASAASGPIQVVRLDSPMGGLEFPLLITNSTTPLALTSISPFFQQPVGASLTFSGTGFDGNPSNDIVTFKTASGTTGATVTAATATSLTVTVPTGAVCGPVTVRVGTQISNPRIVAVSGTTCGLQLIDIWGGGGPGDVIVLEGTGFDYVNPGNNIVSFSSAAGTVNAAVIRTGRTQLHVQIPSTAADGPVTVTVNSATPQTTTALFFHPNAGPTTPVPALISADRSAVIGATTAVTLTGSNFVPGATKVSISGTGIGIVSKVVTSTTSLIVNLAVDANATPETRSVTVSTLVGTSGAISLPIVYPAPSIVSISPNPIGKGTTVVTISGSGFTAASIVMLGNAVIQTTPLTSNSVLATISAQIGSYNLTVTNPSPGGGISNSFPVTVADRTAASQVRVLDPTADVVISELTVTAGNVLQPRVQVIDSTGILRTDIKPAFSSGSPEFASVDSTTGLIRGLSAGASTLTVTAENSVVNVTISVVEVNNGNGSFNSSTRDSSGRLYLAATQDHVILTAQNLKQPYDLYAGILATGDYADGDRTIAKFKGPTYLASDNTDRAILYISDTGNHVIRRIRLGLGTVETVAGRPGIAGHDDGPLASATFNQPKGIGVDRLGNIWVADTGNNTIRRINIAAGTVETIAGSATSVAGNADGTRDQARFNGPVGLAIEPNRSCQDGSCFRNGPVQVRVFVTDTGNRVVRRVTDSGNVTTIRPINGNSNQAQTSIAQIAADVSADTADNFVTPTGIVVDPIGNIYVTDRDTTKVSIILANSNQLVDAVQPNTFKRPVDVSITEMGKVVVADTAGSGGEIRFGSPSISSIDPQRTGIRGGARITIQGQNFTPDTIVIIGSVLISSRTVVNTRTITFTAPALPSGLTTVTVQNRGGLAQKSFLVDAIPLRELAAGQITTIAGGSTFSGDGTAAIDATLRSPNAVATDASGNRYIADTGNHRVRRIDALSGIITTITGNGRAGFSGDNGPAVAASLSSPRGVAIDSAGNIYIADTDNNRIRKVDLTTGVITTIAGGGTNSPGDNAPATSAMLDHPWGIAIHETGTIWFAESGLDTGQGRVRRILSGTITTIPGSFSAPSAVAVDRTGNVYVAETGNHRIQKIAAGSGALSVLAGNGTAGYSGDNSSATAAMLNFPSGVAVDAGGNAVYIADTQNNRIRKVSAGTITSIVAPDAGLKAPGGIATDGGKNLYIADTGNHLVRRVSSSNVIATIAGADVARTLGDSGPAAAARLNSPSGIAVDSSGNLAIADSNNSRLRYVDAATRTILTRAGTGDAGYSGDNGPAGGAMISAAFGAAFDVGGGIFIADTNNNLIRRIAADSTHVITTVAGNRQSGFSGDDSAATLATLRLPYGVAVDTAGNVYIADTLNNRVRKVSAATGNIMTIAGTGLLETVPGEIGDNGPARLAVVSSPLGVAVDSAGNVFIADTGHNRIRKISTDRIITTVAGTGGQGFAGDNGPAVAAALSQPSGVAVDTAGNIYIADTLNNRIRKVSGQTGTISTIAGNDVSGYSGDGDPLPATSATLAYPTGVGVDSEGNVFFTDRINDRVRAIRGTAPQSPASACPSIGFGQTSGSLASTDGQSGNRPGSYSDCYSFTGHAGDRISVAFTSSAFDTYLYLLDSERQIIAFNDDIGNGNKNSRIPQSGVYTIPSTGTYFIDATSFAPGVTGNYTLAFTLDTPQAPVCGSIAYGQAVTGGLTTNDGQSRNRPGSFADCYSFQGNAGDRVSFTAASTDFDTYVFVSDASQTVLLSNDDSSGSKNAAGSLVLPSTGTFNIEVTSFDAGATGSYTLALRLDSTITLPACAPIDVNTTVSAALTANDGQSRSRSGSYADCYTFTGNAGERFTIAMMSTFDTYLSLTKDGLLVASDDDGGGGSNSQIPAVGSLILPSSGTYTIEATSFVPGALGNYTLSLSRADASGINCGTLVYNQALTGALDVTDTQSRNRTARYADCYTFNATAGDRIAITLTSTAFDTYLYLMNAAGQVVYFDDDGGGGSNSRIPALLGTLQIPATGTYLIEVTSLIINRTGGYSLSLTGFTHDLPQCSPITYTTGTFNASLALTDGASVNRPQSGQVADCYSFSGHAGDQVSIGMNSAAFDTYLYLMDSTGKVIFENDDGSNSTNSRIPATGSFTLPGTGTYRIEATSYAPTTGNYTLTLSLDQAYVAPVCTSISIGQTLSGTLAVTDPQSGRRPGRYADCYSFTASSGSRVVLSMNSAAVDSFLYLTNANGDELANDDDSGGENNARIPGALGSFVIPADGTYYIETTSSTPGQTGDYSITLSRTRPVVPGCTTIDYNTTLSGSLGPGDPDSRFNLSPSYADCYVFAGNADDQITISMSSTGFDGFLRLLQSQTAGNFLAVSDPMAADKRVTYTLPSSATFFIEVTTDAFEVSHATGTYSVTLTRTGP